MHVTADIFLNETKYLSVASAWKEVPIASFFVYHGMFWLRHTFTAVYKSTHTGLCLCIVSEMATCVKLHDLTT